MAEKEMMRSEIDDKYKWNLKSIYLNDEDWQSDYEKALEKIEEVIKYKDNFLSSGVNLLTFLEYDEEVERLLGKLYYYASLNHDSNTLDDNYQRMISKMGDLYKKYNELSSFAIPDMLKLDYKVFEKYYKDEKKLLDYKFEIDEIYRFKPHTLDEEKTKMLSMMSKCLANAEDTFEALTDSDLEFDEIKDEKGNLVELNESNYSNFIRSNDRRVRKDAFNLLFNKYASFKNTLASTFSGNIESNITTSKIKKYDSAIKEALFEDNIDIEIYDNLIKTVNDNMNVIYKYYNLKKDVLKLDELHLYDVYAELIDKCDSSYTFDEAKKIVINALSVLGSDYINNLNKAFDERWIDIYHNKGKRSGAYSSGFYDTNPFVLLNYEGKLEDVSTLAHELGHSMHTYYSCKNNPYRYSSYKIFVAEVASLVNELLLSNYLLNNSKDKDEKLSILNHLMELFRTTLYRQTMFAEFEENMYKQREENEALTSSFICEEYYKLNKKYFGKNVVVDDLIKYEWERVPHFYYDFYVYKYATGISCACFIVNEIMSGNKAAKESYLNFLKSGGSMYPVDELKIAGVDISDKKVIESAIKMFDNTIDQFIKLYNN